MGNLWKRNGDAQITPKNYFGGAIQNVFEDFFRDLGAESWSNFKPLDQYVPKMNVSETDIEYRVVVELPGLEEKDFEVLIEDNILKVKGEKKSSFEDKGEHFHRYESSYGSFERAVRLPENIKSDKSVATFKNGVLTLAIAKDKESSKVHKMKVVTE